MAEKTLEALFEEERIFSPPAHFSRQAVLQDSSIYDQASKDRLKFWESFAKELFWFTKWDQVLEWKHPDAKWFVHGQTNISFNCLDRHLAGPRKNKAAILWEGEPGEERTLTYAQLHREVCRFANGLKSLGVRKADRITLYMPMVPELVIALLACARIGAPHSVVFGGFSAEALRDRINDSGSKIVITADGGWRRGVMVPLKRSVDDALSQTRDVEKVVVFRRLGESISMKSGRDLWWHDLVKDQSAVCEPEKMDSEDMLFLLYTSGTTGKPKGIVHTTGGYMVGCYATTKWIFDLKEEDVYWCTADIGWVTGHSYLVYGPLLNGATVLMYEGAPNYPENDRFWAIIEKYRVNVFYTAPTAIRSFMKWGDDLPKRHDLSSLRLLGSVGEPINPEAWIWYQQVIGNGQCPIVDTWWQTETGHILISPLPGITPLKPGSATRPFPGIEADVVNEKGESVDSGYLVIKSPWPGMLRGIYGDPERYQQIYWSRIPGVYFAGDGCKRDKQGYFWLLGRVDDVLILGGAKTGSAEIDRALHSHPEVSETAAITVQTGGSGPNSLVIYTVAKQGADKEKLKADFNNIIKSKISPLFRVNDVVVVDSLPRTASNKVMRRLLRDGYQKKVGD